MILFCARRCYVCPFSFSTLPQVSLFFFFGSQPDYRIAKRTRCIRGRDASPFRPSEDGLSTFLPHSVGQGSSPSLYSFSCLRRELDTANYGTISSADLNVSAMMLPLLSLRVPFLIFLSVYGQCVPLGLFSFFSSISMRDPCSSLFSSAGKIFRSRTVS